MIKALAATGGVMGMNRLDAFISPDKAKQSVEGLAEHVDYIVNLVGIDHVGCGFDFEDYLSSDALSKKWCTGRESAWNKRPVICSRCVELH